MLMQDIATRVMRRRACVMMDGLVGDVKKEADTLLASGKCAAASRVLQRGVSLGHLESRAHLAWLLLLGREGVDADATRAFQLVSEGARLGCPHSLGILALCHIHGAGSILDFKVCERDHERALELSLSSCERGSKYGQFALGMAHYDGNDFTESAAVFSLSAAQGLDAACRWLGILHDDGMGVPQDHVKARQLFRIAAERGFPDAMCAAGHPFPSVLLPAYALLSLALTRWQEPSSTKLPIAHWWTSEQT
jgi:TPR repeat protein